MSTSLPLRHLWRDEVMLSTDDRVDVYSLAVMSALHLHMTADGACTVGVRRIASLARCSVNTARARIAALEAAGFLVVDTPAAGGRTTYRATFPAADPRAVDNPPAAVASVSADDADCVTGRPKRVTGRHTYPYPQLNPQRQQQSTRVEVGPERRAQLDRPPLDVEPVVADDGSLWVTL